MSWFRLGALSGESLTTAILLGVITAYLFSLKGKTAETWYFTGYLAVLFLIQFAYHYREDTFPKESRIVLIISVVGAGAVWLSNFFQKDLVTDYDFHAQYFTYMYGPQVGICTLIGFLWTIQVLIRKTLSYSMRGSRRGVQKGPTRDFMHLLIRPVGRTAKSLGSYVWLTAATALIALLYLLFQMNVISRAVYTLVFNNGSLVICFGIFVVYVNNAPLRSS